MKTQYPLYWCSDWPVTAKKTTLNKKRTYFEAISELDRMCRSMKIKDAVVTSNFRDNRFDGSTAISFLFTYNGTKMAIFCDRYFSATHNLWVIVYRLRASYMISKYNLTIYNFQN